MAINAGLINSQIPLAASPAPAPMQKMDPLGSFDAGLDTAQKISDVQAKVAANKDAMNDRKALQDMYSSGQYDLTSPEGIDKAIQSMHDKLSPSGMMQLITHKQKAQAAIDKHNSELSSLNTDALNQQLTQANLVTELMSHPLQAYDSVKASGGGEDVANAAFRKAVNEALSYAGEQRMPDGKPMFDPQKLASFANMPVAALRQYTFGSKYTTSLIANRLHAAQASAAEERARQSAQTYVDPETGDKYRKAGEANWEVQTSDGAWAAAPNVPSKLTVLGGKSQDTKYMALSAHDGGTYRRPTEGGAIEKLVDGKWEPAADMEGKVWPSKNDKEKNDVKYTPDQLRTAITQYLGGAGRTSVKLTSSPQFLEALQIYKHQTGMSDEDLAMIAKDQKTGEAALRNLQTTLAATKSIEGQVHFNATNALKALDKVHPEQLSDIPLLNKLILSGEGNFTGVGKELSTLGIALDGLLKEYAKISTGSLGNTPTAEKEIQIARQMLNSARTKEDLTATIQYIQKEAKEGRLGSIEDAIRSTRGALRLPSGGGDSGKPAAATPGGMKISPAEQKANDSDRPKILTQEYSKATSPEDKAALQRELKTLGWALHSDTKGNKAFVSPDGKSFIEVK